MKIKTIKNHFNENIYILRAGKVKGRNYLIKHGWKVCNNINFYTSIMRDIKVRIKEL